MDDTIAYAALVAAIFLASGAIKGVIGMGLPTVSVGLLSLFLLPAQAAALMVWPSLITNVWQAFTGRRLIPLLRRLWLFELLLFVGTCVSAGLWSDILDAKVAGAALGAALVLYAAAGLAALRVSITPRAELILTPLIGLLTGFASGLTGVFVMPSVPYLQALLPDKDDLVQALGITFTVATVAIGVSLAALGKFSAGLALQSMLAIAPALIGMHVGQLMRKRISPATFRVWFFAGTFALGAHLVARAF